MGTITRSGLGHRLDEPIDPELEALPKPRRPFRLTTLGTMALTIVLSLFVAWSLRPLVGYAATTGAPHELGELSSLRLGESDNASANTWVHATGDLVAEGVEYRRPLDGDRFRLTQAEGNPHLWVELRVPSEIDPDHYVVPNSFVGRLVRLRTAGLRDEAIGHAVEAALGKAPPDGTWVLIDGEAPATTRWVFGVVVLFVFFAAFNAWGVVRLLSPVRETDA
jgi:hypothetical protein